MAKLLYKQLALGKFEENPAFFVYVDGMTHMLIGLILMGIRVIPT